MIVDIFIPCYVDQIFPDTGINMVKILNKLGIETHYNSKQTCCGQPFYNTGYWNDALHLAKKFVNDFSGDRIVVAPSASCAGFVKHNFHKLTDDKEFLTKLDRIKGNLYEFTDFMVNYLKITDVGATFDAKVTYHDSCSALREYKIKQEPRALLSKVKNLELAEMPDNEVCCGFGGTFMAKFQAISLAMVEQKVNNALSTGAKYIVTTEASCMINISSYINKNKIDITPVHIADVLASGW